MKRVWGVMVMSLMLCTAVQADTIIFKDGKRIDAGEVWEDDGQYKCYMFGSEVGYDKSTVKDVIRTKPKPKPKAEKPKPAPRVVKRPRKTGKAVSKQQVLMGMIPYYNIKKVADIDGQPRYAGLSKNRMSRLEVIGRSEALSSASLSISIPDGNTDIIRRNILSLNLFLQNTIPEWDGASDWVTNVVIGIGENKIENATKTVHGKQIDVTLFRSLRTILVTVTF